MNPFEMLKNLGPLQEKMTEMRERVAAVRVTGTSGGDMVTVEMSGDFSLLDVKILPVAGATEDLEMLQDLIRAAHADAVEKVKERLQEEIGSLTGGLPIPPGLFGGA
jgi:DNA-binding protein, YbaB/EbfC family